MASLRKVLRKLFNKEEAPPAFYWEYYNRTNFVAEKIKALGIVRASVLDVGGIKSNNLLAKFNVGAITTLNISGDSDVSSSAEHLPFDDGSFDVTACIDTLEHIPQNLRDGVVKELVRVARKASFIVAPVDTPENRWAEEFVFYHLPTSGYLKEHKVYGLVDFDHVRRTLDSAKDAWRIGSIEEANLDNLMFWILAMIGDKEAISDLYKHVYFLENKFHPKRKAISVYKAD